jgi:hypothetical protein
LNRIPKIAVLTLLVYFAFTISAHAQTVCPQGEVCYTPTQNADILQKLNELINARDVIAKFTVERAASSSTIDAANKIIDAYKQMDVINGQIIAKQKDVMALYENTLKLQAELIDKLMLKINAPKSAWQKFISAVRDIAILAAGLSIGRL